MLNSFHNIRIYQLATKIPVTYVHNLTPFLLHRIVYRSNLISKPQFMLRSDPTSENGTSSAVGTAPRKSVKIGRSKFSLAQEMNLLRSVLLMPPIGFRS